MGAWAALAVAIALAHGLGIVFLIVGAPPAARRPRLMRWYLLVAAPTAAINLAGQPCPLTVWEKHFWRLAGETPYRGGFVSRYFVEPFGATGLRPGDETILLVAVVAWCLVWLLYAAVRRLRQRSRTEGRPARVAAGNGSREAQEVFESPLVSCSHAPDPAARAGGGSDHRSRLR
ncbi:MAG: DUF2784 domain-containing protein [bacterium]|nr:DUF2784 domain-containing protein [bacterium]